MVFDVGGDLVNFSGEILCCLAKDFECYTWVCCNILARWNYIRNQKCWIHNVHWNCMSGPLFWGLDFHKWWFIFAELLDSLREIFDMDIDLVLGHIRAVVNDVKSALVVLPVQAVYWRSAFSLYLTSACYFCCFPPSMANRLWPVSWSLSTFIKMHYKMLTLNHWGGEARECTLIEDLSVWFDRFHLGDFVLFLGLGDDCLCIRCIHTCPPAANYIGKWVERVKNQPIKYG